MLRGALLVAPVVLALASCAAPPRANTPPVVRIVVTDNGYVLPPSIGSGIREVRLVNHSHEMHEGLLSHFLTPSGNAAAYLDSVRAGVEVPAFAEDVGGPGLAAPGDSTWVWMDLEPGHYVIACWYGDHPSEGGISDLVVADSPSGATEPATDLTVRMRDYSYAFEGAWAAGAHRVRLVNEGTEAHEFDPYRLAPGRSPADFLRWKETGRHGPAPATALGGSGTFTPGHRVWIPLTLRPGRYFAFCEMPAKSNGRPHYQLGMVREFEVR